MNREEDRTTRYQEGSLTLPGTVMLGTGVMIGAGIFALTGQMAQMTGVLFPLAFLAAAVIVSFSAYSYIKISNAYPSAGGIGMYLHKAYGNRLPTAFNALLMYFSMVIAQSFLARTFGSYTMQLFGGDESGRMVPILGVALILAAFRDQPARQSDDSGGGFLYRDPENRRHTDFRSGRDLDCRLSLG